jgi:hypothetical protein
MVMDSNMDLHSQVSFGTVITRFVLFQTPTQVPQICITMENPTTVTLVRNSLVLVMEEVHHKGGFPNDFKGSK